MPPTAFAGMSGVGTFVTSMRSIFPVAVTPRSVSRPEVYEFEAISMPFVVTSVPLAGMPRIETNCGLCGL